MEEKPFTFEYREMLNKTILRSFNRRNYYLLSLNKL